MTRLRIEHIHIDGFGKLHDFDTGDAALGALTVILGPNEAGKSTLFGFLTTALYGFQPASRDRNPHVPWGSDEAGGSVRFRTSEARCVVVERRLRSSPVGTLTREGIQTDLRNHPVPWVEHIPRAVFRQVFAVTLSELAGLDDQTWARIQDRVLGSMGASDLRSARDVSDQLEREASEIWRPNRRGNQRLRDLQERMRALRSKRTEALERDRHLRALIEEREGIDHRLRDVRTDLQRDRIVVERILELLPLKRRLDHVELLREQGGSRDELEGLPTDPRERWDALHADVDRLGRELQEVDEALEEPEALIAAFGRDASRLVAQGTAISAFLSGASGDAAERERRARLIDDERSLGERFAQAAESIFAQPAADAEIDAVAALSVDLLRDRIQRHDQTVAEELAGRSPAAGPAANRGGSGAHVSNARPGRLGPRVLVAAAAGFALLGGILLLWGLSGGPNSATAAGALCMAVGTVLALFRPRQPEPAPVVIPATDTAARLREEVTRMVGTLPIRPTYLDPPSAALAEGLGRLQSVVLERREVRGSLEAASARLADRDREARALAETLGWRGATASTQLASEVGRALRSAERTRDLAEGARREQGRLHRLREATRADVARVEGELATLRGRVIALAKGASVPAIDEIEARVDAHRRADRVEEELQRTHPDLVDLVARIRSVEQDGTPWSIAENDLVERKRRIDDAAGQVEELVGRSRALERDAVHLREQETVDAVDSEMESLRELEGQLVTERDRKWILAQLIREADRSFREEHQPDLLKRASAYLSRLTDGRYERMLVDERSGADLFQLVGPALPTPVPLAPPISTGTLEQAYLSLRLAIVDHLDHSGERLPLFIDEAFVNWDARRRDRGLDVLAEIARTRQVFVFTCHPDMAARLERVGARTIRLER